MKTKKGWIPTGLMAILLFGSTFANAGVITGGYTDPGCNVDSGVITGGLTGVITGGFTGVITGGFTGVITGGLTGIIVTDLASDPCTTNQGAVGTSLRTTDNSVQRFGVITGG